MGPGPEATEGWAREVAWLRATLGPNQRTDCSSGHSDTSVWKVEADGGRWWLKIHRSPRKYAQEHRALTGVVRWLAHRGHRVPVLTRASESMRLLLLTDVPGGGTADPTQAGAFLADLHRAPVPEDPLPLSRALPARAQRWCTSARGLVDDHLLAHALGLFMEPGCFEGLERVVCHRDFSPRNWLFDAEGRLGVIDFEHCGPDLWLVDLLRFQPCSAFFDGYGRRLVDRERDVLERLRWLHAIATVTWARKHGDALFERHGLALLHKAMDGLHPIAG